MTLYLGMGWAGVFMGGAMFDTLSTPVIALMLAGGAVYTTGIIFHVAHRLRFHISIWHGFVLVASGLFFAAINLHLVQTA